MTIRAIQTWRAPIAAYAAAVLLGSTPTDASAAQGSSAGPAPVRAAADTQQVLARGTRVVVPKGWTVRPVGAGVVLGAPEAGSSIALIDGGAGPPDAAVAAAWSLLQPGAHVVSKGIERPAREGWDQTILYRYPVGDGEPRDRAAMALRKGDRWTVVVRDITAAVAERRDASLEVIYNSLLPAGYARETFVGRNAHRLDDARVAQLTALIEEARREYGIPGVALGLVQDGRVVFAGGFGVRELGRPEAVDADTLFNIASNGKAMTTLMLAKLVEAKRITWETPVTSVLPAFRLGDAATTRQVKVKHLICACTGMPRQDYEWLFEGENMTPEAILRLLASAKPTSAFGDAYQYSNLMAAAAGYLGGRVAAPDRGLLEGYDEAMQRLVFDPLGMTATTPDFHRALAANHAAGHGPGVDGVTRVASQGLNVVSASTRPSGNHWSSVNDMLRYVQMELSEGLLPDGTRYIAEAPLLARREVQVTEGLNEFYGMGLKIDRQWGVPVIHHGGSAAGYRSDMIWLPDHQVGAVILVNSDGGSVLRATFRRRLLEVLFDGKPTAEANLRGTAARLRAAQAGQREGLTAPADAEAAARLAVRYRSPELGRLEVRREEGRTVFDFGAWSSEVATRRRADGGVTFVTISPSEDGYEFEAPPAAGPRRLVIRDAQHAYTFVEED